MAPRSIVAIGFSAGGLTPLRKFFDNTPLDDACYILLSHLPIVYQSQLKEILKRHSDLQIREAADEMEVEKNLVYTLPASHTLTIVNNKLRLVPRAKESTNRSIDTFLNSLALCTVTKKIAIILSGAGTDGTQGIAAIKENGGTVIAQDLSTCEFCSMPQNAIDSGNVDYVLSPTDMPEVVWSVTKSL